MRWLGVLPLVLAGVLLTPAQPAAAHPLDAYLQSAYLTPAPGAITLQLDISPGVLVAPAALSDLDRDADRRISDAETHAYAGRVVAQLHLAVDGRTVPLELTGIEMPPYLTIQAGYGVIRLHARAGGTPADGAHDILFRNDHAPAGATYQVTTIVDGPVELTRQQRTETQHESRIAFRLGAAVPDDRLAGLLETPLAPVALLFAALLGALHALTPGHAKTLMAAYLVGSGGTVRSALGLGAVITFTHTASVIVIGLLALFASRFLVPGVLTPALQIVSGVLVLAIGVNLIRQRRRGSHPHPHPHPHPRNLWAMGVSGGLVPCPEALGVMVLAVGVNRTVFGLGLILSFSLGLAAVLMGLGVVLLRSRDLLSRFGRPRWAAALPLVSAVVVTALGAGLLIRGSLPLLS